MTRITLDAASLARKGGFQDGDLIQGLIEDMADTDPACEDLEARVERLNGGPAEPDEAGHCGDHVILIAAVRRHLLPLLPGVEIIDFPTQHNPVRAAQASRDICALSTVSVTIGPPEILEIIRDLEAEKQIVLDLADGTLPGPA